MYGVTAQQTTVETFALENAVGGDCPGLYCFEKHFG